MQIQGMSGSMPPMQGMQSKGMQQESLTDAQRESLEEILSSFDLENMSQEDHMALGEALREAQIPPTEETMEIMQEAGLEPMEIEGTEEMAPPPPPPPPPSMSMSSMSSEDQSFFNDILSQVDSGELSAEELLAQIEEYTGKTSGTMLDLGA
ncbi:MAG: hypothetical protein K0U47_09130 [Epsilonproteobacteria bacterium]|nr:hypothetical protein [Campylobacterota bacterium]